jgi:hypothetical protein
MDAQARMCVYALFLNITITVNYVEYWKASDGVDLEDIWKMMNVAAPCIKESNWLIVNELHLGE